MSRIGYFHAQYACKLEISSCETGCASMQCPECQNESADEAVFCGYCGNRLKLCCESCGALSPAESNFCYVCGYSLRVLAAPTGYQQAQLVPPAPSIVQCPRCDSENEPSSTFCFSCGYPLEDATPPNAMNIGGNVIYGVRPAGFWIRFLAWLIDYIILSIASNVVYFILLGSFLAGLDIDITNEPQTFEDFWTSIGLAFIVAFGAVLVMNAMYYTIGVAVWQTTIGKRLLKIYVVKADGSKVGFGRALGRYFAHLLSAIILYIGYIMIGFRRDKRGLHDLIAGTVVVRK